MVGEAEQEPQVVLNIRSTVGQRGPHVLRLNQPHAQVFGKQQIQPAARLDGQRTGARLRRRWSRIHAVEAMHIAEQSLAGDLQTPLIRAPVPRCVGIPRARREGNLVHIHAWRNTARVFAALDPEEMEKGFVAWVSSIAKLTAGEVVAIDGKALCGTRESGKKTLVHMVSAWAEGNGLVLGQRKVDEKSNEITAIPKLLNALELTGTVVTIDGLGNAA